MHSISPHITLIDEPLKPNQRNEQDMFAALWRLYILLSNFTTHYCCCNNYYRKTRLKTGTTWEKCIQNCFNAMVVQ